MAAPGNDNFVDASDLTGFGGGIAGGETNVDATVEAEEIDIPLAKDVWYKWNNADAFNRDFLFSLDAATDGLNPDVVFDWFQISSPAATLADLYSFVEAQGQITLGNYKEWLAAPPGLWVYIRVYEPAGGEGTFDYSYTDVETTDDPPPDFAPNASLFAKLS